MSGWDSEGNYHDPSLRVEHVEDVYTPLQKMVRHIMQQIVGESPYKADMDWELWHKANELEARDHLPEGVTAWDIHQEYLRVFEGE